MSLRTSHTQVLEQNNLSLKEVYDRLSRKGARLTIVLGDCCNTLAQETPAQGGDLLRQRKDGTRAGLRLNPDNFRNLFPSQRKRSLLSGSASKEQKAWGNPTVGSYYTLCFLGELKKLLHSAKPNPTWGQLLDNATYAANAKAANVACGNVWCKQIAVVKPEPPY